MSLTRIGESATCHNQLGHIRKAEYKWAAQPSCLRDTAGNNTNASS